MGEKDNNFYVEECPGHKTPLGKECETCSSDYNLNHHPNNTNCKFYKLYFEIEEIIEKELLKRGKNLEKDIIDQIVTNLFLRQIISPSTEINYSEWLEACIDGSFGDLNSRKNYIKKEGKIPFNERDLSVDLI